MGSCKSGGKGAGTTTNAEKQIEYVQNKVDEWLANNTKGYSSLMEVTRPDGEVENLYLERETKKNIIDNYIKPWNNGELGNTEEVISVLYNDGTLINTGVDDVKIRTTGIKSVIVEGGWGTMFCGDIKVYHDDVDKYGQTIWHVDFV